MPENTAPATALTALKTRKIVFIESPSKKTPLVDVNPAFSGEELRRFYAGQYPALTNASVALEQIDNVATVVFRTHVGSKG